MTDFVNKINVQFASHYIQSTGLPDLSDLPTNDWDLQVDENEVFMALANCDVKKSTSESDIPLFLCREAATILAGPLCDILNNSISSHQVPDCCCFKLDVLL